MKRLIIIALLLPFSSLGQGNLLEVIDFNTSDSIHIYPSKYCNLEVHEKMGIPFRFNGKLVSRGLLEQYNILSSHYSTTKFYALEKVQFSGQITGMVMGIQEDDPMDSKIVIWLFNKANDLTDKYTLASYRSIPGTMEETMNGWIYDCDNDSDLDIAVMIDLVDYELPNEFSDNISGVEGYAYYIHNDQISYDYLSKENYLSFTIKR